MRPAAAGGRSPRDRTAPAPGRAVAQAIACRLRPPATPRAGNRGGVRFGAQDRLYWDGAPWNTATGPSLRAHYESGARAVREAATRSMTRMKILVMGAGAIGD